MGVNIQVFKLEDSIKVFHDITKQYVEFWEKPVALAGRFLWLDILQQVYDLERFWLLTRDLIEKYHYIVTSRWLAFYNWIAIPDKVMEVNYNVVRSDHPEWRYVDYKWELKTMSSILETAYKKR